MRLFVACFLSFAPSLLFDRLLTCIGLGLALGKEIVEVQGGRVEVTEHGVVADVMSLMPQFGAIPL